jgi:hypothetical protein
VRIARGWDREALRPLVPLLVEAIPDDQRVERAQRFSTSWQPRAGAERCESGDGMVCIREIMDIACAGSAQTNA